MWGVRPGRKSTAMLALAAACTAAPAVAQNATGTVSATTLRPLSLVKLADLEFGSLIPSGTAGRAIVNANTGVRTVSGGVTGVTGPTPQAARFVASGAFGVVALITLPSNFTLTRSGGTETMSVTNITTNGGLGRPLLGSGTIEIRIGARLNVRANQAPGTYTGSFALTVVYL